MCKVSSIVLLLTLKGGGGTVVKWAYSSIISSYGAKGRRFESRPFLFLSFISRKKNHKSTKVSRQEEIEKRAGAVAQERREEEEEEPAGESGKKIVS